MTLTFTRPRVKPEHSPYRISDDRIRIGGVSFGMAGELHDPTGAIWHLLTLMDGSRSADRLVEEVVEAFPGESAATVSAAIEALTDAGHLEELDGQDPPELTERDKARHDRGRMYYRWLDRTPRRSSWEPQVALRRACVTVIGLGGTGGTAALALAAGGVGYLRCVDHDTVELSNLNRQMLYDESDLGLPKVDRAVARLRALNSDIRIEGADQRVTEPADLMPLARDCDVLLLAADRPQDIRRWTNAACLTSRTPWVDAGYHGPLVSLGVYTPGGGPCWECRHVTAQEQHDAIGAIREEDPHRRTAAVANAVAAPSAVLSGALAAHAVVALLTGVPRTEAGSHFLNLLDLEAPTAREIPRRQDCRACAGVT